MKLNKLILHLAIIIILSTIFTTVITHIYNPIYDNVGSIDSWINFFRRYYRQLSSSLCMECGGHINEQQKQFRKILKSKGKFLIESY